MATEFQFQQQIDFFLQKINLPTLRYTDIQHDEHDRAFVVAGATRDALLRDFRAAVDKAIADGTTLEAFRKDFDQIVETHGWTYNGGRNWRSRVIYDTNLRTSYAAGRYAQIQDVKATRPFVRYRHNDAVAHARPLHESWDGLVLPIDSPWIKTHWPPNGWGCRCFIESLSQADLDRLGKAGPDAPPPSNDSDVVLGTQSGNPRVFRTPEGVDPGFGYTPGRSLFSGSVPAASTGTTLLPILPMAEVSVRPLPGPRSASASRVLPSTLTDQAYIDAFLNEFGASVTNPSVRITDSAGDILSISDQLFATPAGLKIAQPDLGKNILLLADTIRSPDEIWVAFDAAGIRRRYVARWVIDGDQQPTLVVFDMSRGDWSAVFARTEDDAVKLAKAARQGLQIYMRGR
ncbi:MAG: PBECR2 nuclease fold domain-containing protein [Nevskia sp.]|jgi:hypothetical protein|nr:PBECR2 nuclease fold domain-containing protein [Nevskia sp.]MCK9385087.1 PBECR2 nuclease fold domain-containing protein [Nevskia sp.]